MRPGWLMGSSRRWCSRLAHLRDNNLVRLTNAATGAELYLLGTMHISQKSADQVSEVIQYVKPNVVAVELCEARALDLLESDDEHLQQQSLLREFWDCPGHIGEKVLHCLFQYFYRTVRTAGIEPAKEFKAAILEGQRLGAKIQLIDRDGAVTRQRLSNATSLWDVIKLSKKLGQMQETVWVARALSAGDTTALENINTRDFARRFISMLEEDFPQTVSVMLHERDEFMTRQLLSNQGTTVGVVGLAHLDGIERKWLEYQSMEERRSLKFAA